MFVVLKVLRQLSRMQTNLLMYLTAMSAVSVHNLINNFNEATRSFEPIHLRTLDTNWTLRDNLTQLSPECNGRRQSPINIETSKVKENLNLRLGLTAYDKPISGFLINYFPTFRLAPFSFKWPRPSAVVSTSVARSFNPYADSHFTLNYIQFNWSQDEDKNLSVHHIDGRDFPLEVHFVHLNTAYADLDEALTRPDGLLIFAVMAVASTHESYVFDRLLDNLSNVTDHEQQVLFNEDSTWRNLLPADTSRFYRYQGSMILPPCHESVQWIVFEDRLKLGQRQLRRLRRFKFLSKDLKTGRDVDWSAQRRPIQNIRDRVVEQSFSTRSGRERHRARHT